VENKDIWKIVKRIAKLHAKDLRKKKLNHDYNYESEYTDWRYENFEVSFYVREVLSCGSLTEKPTKRKGRLR